MIRIVLGAVLVVSIVSIGACKSDGGDNEAYATYQDCYDDHHNVEGLTNKEAISVCCLDHPIGGMTAGVFCGTTEADCETTLRANTDGSVSDAQITEGCTDYIAQRSM